MKILRFTAEMRRECVITLDLAQVRSIDAAGLGLLVELHSSLASAGRQLKFARIPARVRRTIKLVHLHDVLDLPGGHAAAA